MPHPKPQIFVSYRKESITDAQGNEFRRTPSSVRTFVGRIQATEKFRVFLDEERIPGGRDWQETILRELHASDLVLVLLRPDTDPSKDTGSSEWVQREVDMARGDNISILPIVMLNAGDKIIAPSMEKLGLEGIQYKRLSDFDGSPGDQTLIRLLNELIIETRQAQRSRIVQWQERWSLPLDMERYQSEHRFALPGAAGCTLHLGSGDILKAAGIDVIVNSENNYMQMARLYEANTISSRVRFAGSKIKGTRRIMEDSVQWELDHQIQQSPDWGMRPIDEGQVIATHAGHPESMLARSGFRYIFHAASVKFELTDVGWTITPIPTSDIPTLMLNCLNLVDQVNRERGCPGLPGWEEREGDHFQSVTSIIFPIFGTGHGGRPISEVIKPMTHGIHNYLMQPDRSPSLTDIHICIYSALGLDEALNHVDQRFRPV